MTGKTISHDRIIEKLGQSGMGEVYSAEDSNFHRNVVIQVLSDQLAHDPERLSFARQLLCNRE